MGLRKPASHVTALTLASVITAQTVSTVVAQASAAEPTVQVTLTSEIEWGPLNPARGDQSLMAGTLWGDRTGAGPSGFLVRFADGFSSPPHIHNVTYRGLVISGRIHNDDPDAADLWLPPGSFWTQPAGEAHITAAKGENNLAYIEIDESPYLVRPADTAFDTGERPINVAANNLVWLDASDITWLDKPDTPAAEEAAKMAFLWRKPQKDQTNGSLVRLPAGSTSEMRSNGATLRAVVIQGQLAHALSGENGVRNLEPGSYFGTEGASVHQLSCASQTDCVVYVRARGTYVVASLPSEK